jgi:hypothetical protein
VNLLKAAIAFEGPVSVTIDASPPSFYYYQGGVYKPANKDEVSWVIKPTNVSLRITFVHV